MTGLERHTVRPPASRSWSFWLGLVALAVLRERSGGRRLGVVLVALAACLFVQHRLGAAAADGEDTLWLHIPFGVAIIAFAAQANMLARRLESGASG
jgi:peptidoglycan/LPS O-acetylase OafA/YrhL